MESETKPNKPHHRNGQKESLDPAKIAPTNLHLGITIRGNYYRLKYAHLKESGGIGCDQQPIPPCLSNTIHIVYNEIMYLVPAVFKMNWSGISLAKATMASNPVQCVGTIYSGAVVLISVIVF